jgi:hypothetical protein
MTNGSACQSQRVEIEIEVEVEVVVEFAFEFAVEFEVVSVAYTRPRCRSRRP